MAGCHPQDDEHALKIKHLTCSEQKFRWFVLAHRFLGSRWRKSAWPIMVTCSKKENAPCYREAFLAVNGELQACGLTVPNKCIQHMYRSYASGAIWQLLGPGLPVAAAWADIMKTPGSSSETARFCVQLHSLRRIWVLSQVDQNAAGKLEEAVLNQYVRASCCRGLLILQWRLQFG